MLCCTLLEVYITEPATRTAAPGSANTVVKGKGGAQAVEGPACWGVWGGAACDGGLRQGQRVVKFCGGGSLWWGFCEGGSLCWRVGQPVLPAVSRIHQALHPASLTHLLDVCSDSFWQDCMRNICKCCLLVHNRCVRRLRQ